MLQTATVASVNEISTAVTAPTTATQSTYTFERDSIGNLIIPGSAFGGTENVRVYITPQNKILVEVVAFIMAVTGKDRNHAGESWREIAPETKASIQQDLNEDEGDIY